MMAWRSVAMSMRGRGARLVRNLSLNARRDGPLRVYWGSQTGTAHGFAEEFGSEAAQRGFECEVVDLKKFSPDQLKSDTDAVFFVACYGMGEPTDNAKEFYTWLTTKASESNTNLAGTRFAVFGLGSTKTHRDRFCVVGKNVDARMQALGAERMSERVDGDDSDCIEVQFDDWQRAFLDSYTPRTPTTTTTTTATSASKPAPSAAAAAAPKQSATASAAPAKKQSDASVPTPPPSGATCAPAARTQAVQPAWTPGIELKPRAPAAVATPHDFFRVYRQGACAAGTTMLPIKHNIELTPRSGRSTKEMSVAARHAGRLLLPAQYRTGDHLAVYPHNVPELVDAYLQRLDLSSVGNDPDAPVTVLPRGKTTATVPFDAPGLSLRLMLAHFVELNATPSPKVLRTLAGAASCQGEAKYLADLAERDAYKKTVAGGGMTMLDVLRTCASITMPVEAFLETMPLLRPRFYSISSSATLHPDDIHLTYRVVTFRTPHSPALRQGVCTSYLAALGPTNYMLPYDENWIPAYLWQSDFKLPPSPRTPIICVAGGTGIAPFKAFIEERTLMRMRGEVLGPMYLFYGVRDQTELAYKDIVDKAVAEGIITRLHVALDVPPPGQPPQRVTEVLCNEARSVWQALEQGAFFYVCGGSSGFGEGVTAAMRKDVLQSAGGLSEAESAAYFANLIAAKRHLEDLSD